MPHNRRRVSATLQALRFGERCGTITNSARFATASVGDAIRAVDDALRQVTRSLAHLFTHSARASARSDVRASLTHPRSLDP